MSILVDLIFPRICFGCEKIGNYLCKKCREEKIIVNSIDNHFAKNFEGRLSIFKYKGIIKEAIACLKYEMVTDVAEELVDYMVEILKTHFPNLVKYWINNNFVLIPVPLHQYRQNWRGFNQSELLGEMLAEKLGLSFNSKFVERIVYSESQVIQKHKKDRVNKMENYFKLNNEEISKNKRYIIFDDVITTGSTTLNVGKTIGQGIFFALSVAG